MALAVAGCQDNSDDSDQEATISYGDTVEGELSEDSPVLPDYPARAESYMFEGETNDVVDITMTSDAFDTYLLLTRSQEGLIGENDDDDGIDSRLIRGLPEDGLYTIWASTLTGGVSGEFTLSLSTGSRDQVVPPSATEIADGETVQGTVTPDSPKDPYFRDLGVPYTIEGNAGETITVSMDSTAMDPYVLVTDRDGRLVARDNPTTESPDGRLRESLPENGTYVIWAESTLGKKTGRFTLSFERTDNPQGGTQ